MSKLRLLISVNDNKKALPVTIIGKAFFCIIFYDYTSIRKGSSSKLFTVWRKAAPVAPSTTRWSQLNVTFIIFPGTTCAVFNNRHLRNSPNCQNASIGWVDDCRKLIYAKHTQVGNGKGAAFPIGWL